MKKYITSSKLVFSSIFKYLRQSCAQKFCKTLSNKKSFVIFSFSFQKTKNLQKIIIFSRHSAHEYILRPISVLYIPDPDLFPRSIIICCGSGKFFIINIGPCSVCFYFTILVPSVLKPPFLAGAVKKGAAPALQLKLQL